MAKFNFNFIPVYPVERLEKCADGGFERRITWAVGYPPEKPRLGYTQTCLRRPAQDPAIAKARAKLVAETLAYKARNFPDLLATQTDWRERRRYGTLGTR